MQQVRRIVRRRLQRGCRATRHVLMLPQEELRLERLAHRHRDALILEYFHQVRRVLVDLRLRQLDLFQALPVTLELSEEGVLSEALLDLLHRYLDGGERACAQRGRATGRKGQGRAPGLLEDPHRGRTRDPKRPNRDDDAKGQKRSGQNQNQDSQTKIL